MCLCTREKQKCLTLIYYTDMTEINTTLSANGVFLFLFFFQALQFSFNTAIRGPSKFTRGFVFFTLLSFFFSFFSFLNVSIVADWCLFIDAFTVLFCYQSIYIGELGDAGI